MKRNDKDIVKGVEELFDELAHNYGITVAQSNEDELLKYLLHRIYYILYQDTQEWEGKPLWST